MTRLVAVLTFKIAKVRGMRESPSLVLDTINPYEIWHGTVGLQRCYKQNFVLEWRQCYLSRLAHLLGAFEPPKDWIASAFSPLFRLCGPPLLWAWQGLPTLLLLPVVKVNSYISCTSFRGLQSCCSSINKIGKVGFIEYISLHTVNAGKSTLSGLLPSIPCIPCGWGKVQHWGIFAHGSFPIHSLKPMLNYWSCTLYLNYAFTILKDNTRQLLSIIDIALQ